MVTAVVVKKKEHGEEVTEEEIIKFSRERLTVYKCPKLVKFVDELPRSAFMKVLKRELWEMFKN